MNAETYRKRALDTLKALKVQPNIHVLYAKLGPKMKPEKLDGLLQKAGVRVGEQAREYMCAFNGFELQWVSGEVRDGDTTDAFIRRLGEHRCRFGGSVGHIKVASWSNVFQGGWGDRSNYEPHHRVLDEFYRYLADDDLFELVHLDCNPELSEPLVRFGDDYGADFASGIPMTIPAYCELLLSAAGTGRKELMCRGSGRDYPVMDQPDLLEILSPAEVAVMVGDGDEGLRATWRTALDEIHKKHPAGG